MPEMKFRSNVNGVMEEIAGCGQANTAAVQQTLDNTAKGTQ